LKRIRVLLRPLWRLRRRLRRLANEQRNTLWLYLDAAFLGVLSGGALAFLPVYVVRSGATPTLVSLLSALPALMTTLASLPAGRLIERARNLVHFTMLARMGLRIAFLIFAILPSLLNRHQPQAFIAVWTVAAVPMAFANVSFTTLLAETVPPARLAQVVSTRLAIHGLTSALTGFLAGRALDLLPHPANYQIIFLVGFASGLLSVLCLGRVRLLAWRPYSGRAGVPAVQHPGLRQRWRTLRQAGRSNAEFTRLQLAATWFRLGMSLPSALFSIYWVNQVRASDTWIGLVTTTQMLFGIVGYYTWGRLATRRGGRRVLVLASLGLSSYPLLTALARAPSGLLLPAIAGGLFSAGLEVAFLDVLLLVCPRDRRPHLVAANSMLANLVLFAGPLLGAMLAEAIGVGPALLWAAAIRLSGGLLFYALRVGARPGHAPAEARQHRLGC
jgi:MFS family permease